MKPFRLIAWEGPATRIRAFSALVRSHGTEIFLVYCLLREVNQSFGFFVAGLHPGSRRVEETADMEFLPGGVRSRISNGNKPHSTDGVEDFTGIKDYLSCFNLPAFIDFARPEQ